MRILALSCLHAIKYFSSSIENFSVRRNGSLVLDVEVHNVMALCLGVYVA